MNRVVFGILVTLAASATGVCIIAARHVPTIRANTFVGQVPVGGLSTEEASRRLRVWWEGAKLKTLHVKVPDLQTQLPDMTPGQLGVTLDDQSCVAKLPLDDLTTDLTNVVSHPDTDRLNASLIFKANGADLRVLADTIDKASKSPQPAKALFDGTQVVRSLEVAPEDLDVDKVPDAVIKVLPDGDSVDLPVKGGTKRVPDDQLNAITDVVSQFSTHFSTWNRPRCWNIRLASSKLRGVILMPGERFSFNGTVGRRTLKGGFRLAGVYKNGKHDVGIGGGICQVSTTLYNACLFGDLKIRQRSNHSLPVPYVPLGRDATVDYGDLDLVVENTYPTPIAIDSQYQPGKLTFRILGKKDPGLAIHVTESGDRSWNPGVRTVIDRSLKPGSRHIVEKGSWGHSVSTYRSVYENGKLVRREVLSHSTYGGQVRVVAYNPAPKLALAPKLTPKVAPVQTSPAPAPAPAGNAVPPPPGG